MEELLAYIDAVAAIVPISGSAAAIVPTAVNASGRDHVCFLISTGAMATGSGLSCRVTESTSATGTFTDVTSAALTTVLAASGGSKVYAIDTKVSNTKPYLKLAGTAGTAAVLHSAVALLYGGSRTFGAPTTTQYVRV